MNVLFCAPFFQFWTKKLLTSLLLCSRSSFQTFCFRSPLMPSVCFGGLSPKYLWRGFFYRPRSQPGDFSRYWPFHVKTLQLFSGSVPHKALLSSLSRSDVFVHTLPAPQKKGEILFTSAFDIHLLFLQSFRGALFAQWNRLCLEGARQWRAQ